MCWLYNAINWSVFIIAKKADVVLQHGNSIKTNYCTVPTKKCYATWPIVHAPVLKYLEYLESPDWLWTTLDIAFKSRLVQNPHAIKHMIILII